MLSAGGRSIIGISKPCADEDGYRAIEELRVIVESYYTVVRVPPDMLCIAMGGLR